MGLAGLIGLGGVGSFCRGSGFKDLEFRGWGFAIVEPVGCILHLSCFNPIPYNQSRGWAGAVDSKSCIQNLKPQHHPAEKLEIFGELSFISAYRGFVALALRVALHCLRCRVCRAA